MPRNQCRLAASPCPERGLPGAVVRRWSLTVPLVVLFPPPLGLSPPPLAGCCGKTGAEEEAEEEGEAAQPPPRTPGAGTPPPGRPATVSFTRRIVECCEDSKCPAALGRLLSGLSSAQRNSYTREFSVFHNESCLQPCSTWGSLWKP
nr:protein FAM168A isoform X3 [Chrysemys picta bellii]